MNETFEQTYARLEEILEKMNSGRVPLDESLKLFDEANTLIASCSKRLLDAEQKIEILLKQKELNQPPQTAPFT